VSLIIKKKNVVYIDCWDKFGLIIKNFAHDMHGSNESMILYFLLNVAHLDMLWSLKNLSQNPQKRNMKANLFKQLPKCAATRKMKVVSSVFRLVTTRSRGIIWEGFVGKTKIIHTYELCNLLAIVFNITF
jgi:hypothetical protein